MNIIKKAMVLLHATLLTALVIFAPSDAYAYVDPGFFSSIYQFVYVVLFGFVASLVFKPWTYFKTKFFKKNDDKENCDDKPTE